MEFVETTNIGMVYARCHPQRHDSVKKILYHKKKKDQTCHMRHFEQAENNFFNPEFYRQAGL